VNYFFSEAAGAEHLGHVAWYRDRNARLGARYLAAFDAAIGKACEHPDRFPIEAAPAIRRVRVPGFPINILYRIVGAEIEVLAVAHHRRRPGYWSGQG
jgi:toxin ParE1/3/4